MGVMLYEFLFPSGLQIFKSMLENQIVHDKSVPCPSFSPHTPYIFVALYKKYTEPMWDCWMESSLQRAALELDILGSEFLLFHLLAVGFSS